MFANSLPNHPHDTHLVVVIPAYNEANSIDRVLSALPSFVHSAIVVDDGSTDETREVVQTLELVDPRIELICHESNQGVGSAMVTGFRRALELGADVIVKIDADGQMAPADLPVLIEPLVSGQADYAKGNRFRDFTALRQMPSLRRAGNLVLSFLTKVAVGYWSCFDPCNGYVAVRGDVLARVPLDRLKRSFFFETSLLAELYLLDAVVADVPLGARYADEVSHLSISKVTLEFPWRLGKCLLRRLTLKNFIYDFNMLSIYLLSGLALLGTGATYGGINWIRYALQGIGAPTGTVVIPAMMIILGFQLLLSAIQADMQSVPQTPLWRRLRPTRQPRQQTPETQQTETETEPVLAGKDPS